MLAYYVLSTLAVTLPVLASSAADATLPYGLDKRSLNRESAVRVALAKARAAKRSIDSTNENDLVTRTIDEAYSAVGLSRRDFEEYSTLSKRSQPRARCTVGTGRNAQATANTACVRFYRGKVSYSSNAIVTCNAVCEITCPSGYTAQSTDKSTVCIKNVDKCAGKKCPTDANGVSGCGSNGVCSLKCTTRGYALNKRGTACINTAEDANNCGSEGNKCGKSYDGKYAAACENSKCSLACPRGFAAGNNRRRQFTCIAA